MDRFLEGFQDQIIGVLSCFDRLVFRGHLELRYPRAMERFLEEQGLLRKDFKDFVTCQANLLKEHARDVAQDAGRPFIYLESYIRKEDQARKIAQRDDIQRGLVCVFSAVEPCSTFKLCYGESRPHLENARRKCLFLYFYFMDREFGLMHVRLQTWFPFQIQVYINGHEWLARKLSKHGIDYHQLDNAFSWIADIKRAQKFADNFAKKRWPRLLEAFARRVNPLLNDLLNQFSYYWVTDQSEFATDVMFQDHTALQGVYPKLLRHSTLCLGAEDVLTFLGKKLHPNFAGEVLTDYKHRIQGARVKHRVKENWIKMYDKHGCVLRIETVINHPYEFKIRRRGMRKGKEEMGWYPMAKRVSNLHRYAHVSLRANARYLDALAAVYDPSSSYGLLQRVCEPARFLGRKSKGFNPLSKQDSCLFAAVMRGEHVIRGFCNGDIVRLIFPRTPKDEDSRRRAGARVTRFLQRLRAHGLIAKYPRSRRYRVTTNGYLIMGAAVHLREEEMPQLLQAE